MFAALSTQNALRAVAAYAIAVGSALFSVADGGPADRIPTAFAQARQAASVSPEIRSFSEAAALARAEFSVCIVDMKSLNAQEPGSWGGFRNGHIPDDALSPVPWAPQHRLRADAADALAGLNEAFRDVFGHDLRLNDGYRSYAQQVIDKATYGRYAAEAGTSNHGWALAIDIGDRSHWLIDFDHPIYLWLVDNAPRYGWVNPEWALPGGSGPDEAWHWEYWR